MKKLSPNIGKDGYALSQSMENGEDLFPILGIGASAGGLEALEQFFKGIPADSGLAFVVIQHLDPAHKGIMPELLRRFTEMKVLQATERMLIKANHVYIIPPNKSLTVSEGYLRLQEPVAAHGLRLPIDYFFTSLAEYRKELSAGLILSGMGSDGSIGLQSIKEKKGIAAAQAPLSANFKSMPESAIKAVDVDIVAPANEIGPKLILALKERLAAAQETAITNYSDLDKIIVLLRHQTRHDFSLYKKNTIFRRIDRRMHVHQITAISDYLVFLQANLKEIDILFKELLIGVTNFFRDALMWEKLKQSVLPELFAELPSAYALRVWVTGCSSGEEAYSVAITFMEAYEEMEDDKNLSLQIFATDIDVDAIDRARSGIFSDAILSHVSQERIDKYFTKENNTYRINTSIREMIVFAPHDVIKDAPFTKLDLLFCRNLLIYMEPELQKKLMNLFFYSLKAGGTMVLGSAEHENTKNEYFDLVDARLKIYKRSRKPVDMAKMDFPNSFSNINPPQAMHAKQEEASDNIQTLADEIVIQRYAPPSVLVNSEGDILYITGKTGNYLEPAAGKVNWNIYVMAREGLNHELPAAIRKAKQSQGQVKLINLHIGRDKDPNFVDVTFQRIDKPAALKGTIMLIFEEHGPLTQANLVQAKGSKSKSSIVTQELELELQRAKDELQFNRAEMQTTREELMSTNEEMQSTNEELQSTNEELTTSREEMQSLNEELQTVNLELQSKIDDYQVSRNDLKNLLDSTNIATLFLDKDLNIRRFTDPLTELFKVRQVDIGRPFTDMVSDLNYPAIADDAKEVLRSLIFKETNISAKDQRWFKARLMPYRTLDDRIDGVVITFIDVTLEKLVEMKSMENHKEEKEIDNTEIVKLKRSLNEQNELIEKLRTELQQTSSGQNSSKSNDALA